MGSFGESCLRFNITERYNSGESERAIHVCEERDEDRKVYYPFYVGRDPKELPKSVQHPVPSRRSNLLIGSLHGWTDFPSWQLYSHQGEGRTQSSYREYCGNLATRVDVSDKHVKSTGRLRDSSEAGAFRFLGGRPTGGVRSKCIIHELSFVLTGGAP